MNMRERMARAIFEGPPHEWDRMDPIIRGACFRQADAALSALAEPTEAMVIGARNRYPDGDNSGPTLYHDIFRAMIGAAGEG